MDTEDGQGNTQSEASLVEEWKKESTTGRPVTLESHLQKLKAIEDKIRHDLTDSKLKHDQYRVLTRRL